MENVKVGSKVYFGRSHGEQTLGEVIKVNRVTANVKQLESRGTYKAHAVGTIWKVPARLLTEARVDAVPSVARKALIELPPVPAWTPPAVFGPKTSNRSDQEILGDIADTYGSLSPENLYCDGERPAYLARKIGAQLNRKLRSLFVELGREVNETEAYNSQVAKKA